MRYLAAYLLLVIGGNSSPSVGDIKSLIECVGIEVDEDRIEKLLSELKGKGKSLDELIAEGATKFASVSTGGAVAAAGGTAAPAAPGTDTAAAAAAAAEEKKEEEKEESDEDMGFGLFD